MIPWQPIPYHSFAGGWNTQSGPFDKKAVEAGSMDNWITDVNSALTIRPGYALMSSYADSATPITTCLFQYRPEGGTAEWLRMASNTAADAVSLRRYNSATGNWDNITATGFTPSGHTQCVAVAYQNRVYFANGVDILSVYDQGAGQTWTAVANSPIADFVLVHYDRLWTNNSAAPSAMRCSAAGNAADWTGTDSLTLFAARGDGDEIMAAHSLYGVLLVFKRDRIFTITGTGADTFSVELAHGDAGALSARGVVRVENLVYFLSEKGFYATDGDTVTLVSNQIRPDRFATNRALDARVVGMHDRRRNLIIWCVGAQGSATFNRALTYRYQPRLEESRTPELGSWCRFTNWPFHSMAVFQDTVTPTEDDALLAGNYSGQVFLIGQTLGATPTIIGTDNTAVIPADMRFAWQHGGDETRLKRIRQILVTLTDVGVSPNVTYRTRVDAGVSGHWFQPRIEVYNDNGTARGRLTWYTNFNEATAAAGPFTPTDWAALTRARIDGATVYVQTRSRRQAVAA